MSRKITKIVINILQKNSDNEKYFQKSFKQAIFEILRLHNLKFQIPTAYRLKLNWDFGSFWSDWPRLTSRFFYNNSKISKYYNAFKYYIVSIKIEFSNFKKTMKILTQFKTILDFTSKHLKIVSTPLTKYCITLKPKNKSLKFLFQYFLFWLKSSRFSF